MNEQRLHDLIGKAINDFGGAYQAPLVMIGDRLGLYKAMAGQGPMTPAELATRTGTNERYVREWLNAHAAAGYIDYEAGTCRYILSP
ncbi:MAG: SAM-dependent methyltransferase, partial [Bryobacterales bacterium]|nr:SAM-dependent methyltransferase [Bryobacterales bacterium]